MNQSKLIIDKIKMCLKQNKKTYVDVANYCGISRNAVQKMFDKESITLHRMEEICNLMGMTIVELTRLIEDELEPTSKLTNEQEEELARDPKLLLLSFLLVNDWNLSEMKVFYNFEDEWLEKSLFRLYKMKIIDLLQPGNRIKVLISRNFSWKKNGPVHRLIVNNICKEFMASNFIEDDEFLKFVSGMVSRNTFNVMRREFEKLANDFNILARSEVETVPIEERFRVQCTICN